MAADRIHGMTRAEWREFVARERAAQGLPRYVEDPEAIRKIATLLKYANNEAAVSKTAASKRA